MKLWKTLPFINRCNSLELVPTKNVNVANMINVLNVGQSQVQIESLTLNGGTSFWLAN